MTIIDRKRLIADEGKLLVNGAIQGSVVDIASEDIGLWTEIPKPLPEEPVIPETPPEQNQPPLDMPPDQETVFYDVETLEPIPGTTPSNG